MIAADYRLSYDSWGREVYVCQQCHKRLEPSEFRGHVCNDQPWRSLAALGPGAGEYKPVATAELVEDDDDLAFDEEYGYGGVR